MVSRASRAPGEAGLTLAGAGAGRTAAAGDLPRPPHEMRAAAHARRDRVPRALRRARALALPRRTSIHAGSRRGALHRRVFTGRVDQRAVRRQLELARADLAAGQLLADRVAAAVSSLLRR